MASSDQIQMLVSAFIFGLLFQGTITALLIYINGHGSTIFKDRQRLVLILFLISSALWAQIDFINFAIPSSSSNACQATILISTFFDQAARATIGGFLLWSVGHVKKTLAESYGLGTLVGIRIVVGGIFVAYARPQFAPACVARSDLLPASVTVMALDIIIIGVLAIRVFTLGLLGVIKEVRSSTEQQQSKALIYCVTGLFLWTLSSAPMLIGIQSMVLLLRTALPAIGLMILVSIITIFSSALVLPRDDDSSTPEARSPFVAPPSHSSSTLSNDNGSPVHENGYTTAANLFVVNPSRTPHDSSVMTYLEDVKAEDNGYIGYPPRSVTAVRAGDVSSLSVEDVGRNRASSRIFQSVSDAPLEAVSSSAFLPASRRAPLSSSAKRIEQTKTILAQDVPTTKTHQKRARFGWSKKSADKIVQKISISNPVIDDAESLSAQLFTRMKTVDLATAAASERERREGAKNSQLVAKRPAPPPPTASETWRKMSSTRRKEIPRVTSAPVTLNISNTGSNDSRLSITSASSTSASSSPGREDIRRRSPRSTKSLQGDIETAYFLASRPDTIALPKAASPQTVMYVNDIVYDHPGMVKSIMSGASTTARKSASVQHVQPVNAPTSSTTQLDSIMHRPRPYRRDSEKDRVIFPRHKRSKSSPSVATKKSVPQLNCGSSSDVPTVPQRPTTAAGLRKLLPNHTRSMTVDEKISLLFPAPPGVHHICSRRSSVPSLPRIPSSILRDSLNTMLTDQELQDRRASKRTTISFGGQVQNDSITPVAETPIINEYGIYRFSANTYRTLAESPSDSRNPSLPGNEQITEDSKSNRMQSHASNGQRQSTTTNSSSEADGSRDDFKLGWASIHSPVPAIDVITAQQTARETYIRMRKDARVKVNQNRPQEFGATTSKMDDEAQAIGNSEGLMTVMIGMSDVGFLLPANSRPFLLNSSPIVPDKRLLLPPTSDPWHRRIGDELPAFSERRKHLRSRTMPPPTPLLLRSNSRQEQVAISKPVITSLGDSPETALKEIQAQLNKFEDASRESLGSLMSHVPQDSLKWPTVVSDDKLDLLANLEREIGQQETHWMRMQHSFDRDSNSVIMTPQVAECTPRALPSPPSEESSRGTTRSVDRRLRIRSNSMRQSEGGESNSAVTRKSLRDSRANNWQQRLAEAQVEFVENAPALLGSRNVNFLSISKAQLGSPTPPDSLGSESDSETDMDYDTDEQSYHSEIIRDAPLTELKRVVLWKPRPSAFTVRVGHLWSPDHEISTLRTSSFEPAAKELRPVQRRDQYSLPIASSALWSKPTTRTSRPPVGLWGSRTTRPQSIITRPKAQRPQRKSKRITLLPDILESPSPLPHKRDTLGIFQFPWGEKSESAVYDPIRVPNQASLNPFILNPAVETKPAHLDTEPTDYSSSFFDDYEEENEGEPEADCEDDFDESTLWEIATLLNSHDVPSRNSLLPRPRIIEDYDDDNSELDVTGGSRGLRQSTKASARPEMVKFIPIKPLKPSPPLPTSKQIDDCEQVRPGPDRGFQQLVTPVWQAYLPALDDAVRGKLCQSLGQESRPKKDARSLWDKAIGAVSTLPVEKAVAFWTLQSTSTAKKPLPTFERKPSKDSSREALWTAQQTQIATHEVGLYTAGSERADYCTNHQIPATPATFRKRRINTTPLPAIQSQELWTLGKQSSFQRHWIYESSVRALSPSLSSTSLSGQSSPASGRSIAGSDKESFASASTDASFVKSSDTSGEEEPTNKPVLRDNISLKTGALPVVYVGQSKVTAPVEQTSERPISLKESRGLASRNLWESRAPVLESTSTRTTWKLSKINLPDAFQENQGIAGCTATEAESNAILSEAIPQGHPRLQRPSASLRDWETALTQALIQSAFPVQGDNVGAAIKYDPAVCHPVYFNSHLISRVPFVQIAAIGHVAQPAQISADVQKSIQLWAPSLSIAIQAPSSASLWTKLSSVNKDSSSQLASLGNYTTAREATKYLPSLILPTLSSTSLWGPTTSIIPTVQHWLHTATLGSVPASSTANGQSSLSIPLANTFFEELPALPRSTVKSVKSTETKRPQLDKTSNSTSRTPELPAPACSSTWTAAKLLNTVSGSQGSNLWTPTEHKEQAQEKLLATQDVLTKRPSSYRLSSSKADVEKVKGTELWRPKRGLPKSPRDWLTSRRATKVDFRY